MARELAKNYDPKSFEKKIYEAWEADGDFHAEIDENKRPFTIVMPPPNITGQLHMGHALDQTLQDVLTRFKRLQGFSALWLPGTDHASIATEVKVADDILKTEGKTKDEIGRDEFLKRAWKWKEIYGGKITEQQRRLGDSCDWERERFTMDEGCNEAVVEFFVTLYEQGLIYKGSRLINWCPDCGTTLSDAEVEHEDLNGQYWYFRYPDAEDPENPEKGITVATSRPETMFADAAIAVRGDDPRYVGMIGKKVLIPLVNREIPVIADSYPDPEKGTGAVKITPAHDPNDFEVGERHGLPQLVCIDFDAKMTDVSGKYEGQDRFACRKNWVADLDAGGFLVKTENVVIPTGKCYRCGTIVEPMISEQWFVKMEELAKPAIEAAKKKDLKHVPDRFEKTYLHWLEEIRDWCISRQLWWGHRIPAYYCDDCGELIVSREKPDSCPKCGGKNLTQDEDVLDTWFSSALWPFSTLGWPEKSPDMDYFYPTNVLVTGYDIIFFWVVRMVFSALKMTGSVPFEHVFVHGLVRDSEGRKMSKSLGNGVDPLEVIDQYGADALRFMLLNGSAAGNDMRFTTDKVESARNFANKLWNASRFVLMSVPESGLPLLGKEEMAKLNLADEDKWILHRTEIVAAEVTNNLESFELSVATQKIFDLIKDDYCDWYIELVKSRLYGEDEEQKEICLIVLVDVLSDLLRLLHPFMPFITEEIWSYLNKPNKLIVDAWPEGSDLPDFKEENERIELVKSVIRAIRNIKAEAEAPPSKKLTAVFKADAKKKAMLEAELIHIEKLANITSVAFADVGSEDSMTAVASGVEIFIPAGDLIDFEAEKERLSKEIEGHRQNIKRLSGKLNNEGFVAKAPEAVVLSERAKLAAAEDSCEKLSQRLRALEERLAK
ncbi:MAG: valine--tRNA ligase [Clostridiales Family XIII bacterium]|jgi:valyl-tRNA synthetase|nr:valine--tRNA ligase [Clostridiales Family XIII bacterium]